MGPLVVCKSRFVVASFDGHLEGLSPLVLINVVDRIVDSIEAVALEMWECWVVTENGFKLGNGTELGAVADG